MKVRYGILATVMLLMVSGLAFSQSLVNTTAPWNNSFRNASTAGLLEDDLDLTLGLYGYLDPARIELINGKRLYTNLSNFITKNEAQFQPLDVGTFLIGGTSDLMNLGKVGLLYDRYNNEQPQYVGVDNEGNPAYGTLRTEQVTLQDIDGLPGYETRQTVSTTTKAAYIERAADYFVAFAKSMGDIKAGIALHRTSEANILIPAGRNFSTEINQTNLVTNQTTLTVAEKDTGRTGNEKSTTIIGLSAWKPLSDILDMSLRFSVGFGTLTNIDEEDYSGDSVYVGGDSYNRTLKAMLTDKRKGTELSFGTAGIYKWSDIVNTRADVQLSTFSYKPDGDAKYTNTTHEAANTINPLSTDVSYNDNISGKYNGSGMDVRIKNTVRWNKVEFAVGAGLTTGKTEDLETRARTSSNIITYRENGDASLPASYVATTTWNETWEYSTNYAYHTITIPVGLEFNLTKLMLFRLGARHAIYYYETTENITLTAGDNRMITSTVYGDGTVTNAVTPNPLTENTGSSTTTKGHTSSTSYSYGACWKVTPNLQLDFMGFARLTDLTDWKLSAVIKF